MQEQSSLITYEIKALNELTQVFEECTKNLGSEAKSFLSCFAQDFIVIVKNLDMSQAHTQSNFYDMIAEEMYFTHRNNIVEDSEMDLFIWALYSIYEQQMENLNEDSTNCHDLYCGMLQVLLEEILEKATVLIHTDFEGTEEVTLYHLWIIVHKFKHLRMLSDVNVPVSLMAQYTFIPEKVRKAINLLFELYGDTRREQGVDHLLVRFVFEHRERISRVFQELKKQRATNDRGIITCLEICNAIVLAQN